MGGMFVLRILSQLVTLATIIAISRSLGPDDFGRYSFLYGFLIFLTLFNVNGLNDILVREMASHPDRRDTIYRSGLTLKLAAGIFTFILACTILLFFNVSSLPKWASCIAALTLFVSFSMGSFRMVWDVPYQVDFRMTSASTVNLAGRLLFFMLLMIWMLSGSGSGVESLTGLGIGAVVVGVSTVILLQTFSEMSAVGMQTALNIKFNYRMLPRWDAETMKYLLREVWPLAVAGGLGMIYTKSNLLMIQYFLTEREVGLFALPMKLVDALAIIPTVFIVAVLPILSRMYRESREKFLNLAKLSYRIMLCLSFPIVAVVMFHSGTIVEIISGESYSASAPVLAILIWAVVLWFSGVVFNYLLITSGWQLLLMIIYGAQAIASIVLNLAFIPRFGIIGAAWATILTYFIMFPICLLFKEIGYAGRLWFSSLLIPGLSALATGYAANLLGLSLLPATIFILGTFFVLVFLTGYISGSDLLTIRDILSSRAEGLRE